VRKNGSGGGWRDFVPEKIKSQLPNSKGYLAVRLCKNGRVKTFRVHSLVLLAFIGPRQDWQEARHFPDRDPTNNRLSNLSWSTHVENMRDLDIHGTARGRFSLRNRFAPKGEKNGNAELNKIEAWSVWRFAQIEGLVDRKIGEWFGISQSLVGQIKRREKWRHLEFTLECAPEDTTIAA
jgi:hypothetical protein